MAFFEVETPEYDEERARRGEYTKTEIDLMASEMLREDGRRELCRICLEDGHDLPYGDETGHCEGIYVLDEDNTRLIVDGCYLIVQLPELQCSYGHNWFKGEGKTKGLRGSDAVLLEEHMTTRVKREIYNKNGYPDPSIQSGIFNRSYHSGVKETWQSNGDGDSFDDE